MKTKKTKKPTKSPLRLARETLKALTGRSLTHVAGGATVAGRCGPTCAGNSIAQN